MSVKLDKKVEGSGTKFKLFVQSKKLESFREPETIRISLPPEEIQPGPADGRMFVLDAIDKVPYSRYYPRRDPYDGTARPPVTADEEGHFDHLDVSSREFSCATMYATVRRVLDIWEDYFGHTIQWYFQLNFDRLQLIPLVDDWNNAHSGYGFLEFGYGRSPDGTADVQNPYCQNFDVLAHELGHSIINREVGIPTSETRTYEYGGFHESCGDLVALLASLHFNKMVDLLLKKSSGNLFTVNELSRVGELSNNRQIRLAFNYQRMSTVSEEEEHDLSKPLTGAIFDIFVEVFQKNLVKAGLISQELADLSYHGPSDDIDDMDIQNKFDEAYEGNAAGFKDALLGARDYLGELLAHAWAELSPNHLLYVNVGLQLLASDEAISSGEHQQTIRECFQWREITFPGDSIGFKIRSIADCGLI